MPDTEIRVEGHAGRITLNRPQALNALNTETLAELIAALAAYDADPGQRCLVLTGSEKAFAAGADIKQMQSRGFADMYAENFFAGWEKVTATRKPWFAAVAGFALGGGCELALACDIRIASEKAKFGQPEVNLGILPGYGGTQRTARLLGRGMAMYLCLSGELIDAPEALRIGLVEKVVAPAELLGEARRIATVIASRAPLAVAAAKRAIDDAISLDLEPALEIEALHFGTLIGTKDFAEGTRAFLEKRAPSFTNS
jgi:enoyl-CoA hydratase